MSDKIKVIEQAQILTIFNDSVGAGFFLVKPAPRGPQMPLVQPEVENTNVWAHTICYWIESLKYGLVVQWVAVNYERQALLSKTHLYNTLDRDTPRITPLSSYMSSGRLLRKVVEMADKFKDEIEAQLPLGVIDEADARASMTTDALASALDEVAAQVNAGAMGPNVTATVNVNGKRPKRGRK